MSNEKVKHLYTGETFFITQFSSGGITEYAVIGYLHANRTEMGETLFRFSAQNDEEALTMGLAFAKEKNLK